MLSEQQRTVFFYLGSGTGRTGGPFSRGAAIVELNPNYPGKKEKKYIVYEADVEGMQPIGKGKEWFRVDKSRDVAQALEPFHFDPAARR